MKIERNLATVVEGSLRQENKRNLRYLIHFPAHLVYSLPSYTPVICIITKDAHDVDDMFKDYEAMKHSS